MTEAAHKKCSCSRNRRCAMHQAQLKPLLRKAKETHDRERVQVGIEELRARYAKPEREAPRPTDRRAGRNGWTGR